MRRVVTLTTWTCMSKILTQPLVIQNYLAYFVNLVILSRLVWWVTPPLDSRKAMDLSRTVNQKRPLWPWTRWTVSWWDRKRWLLLTTNPRSLDKRNPLLPPRLLFILLLPPLLLLTMAPYLILKQDILTKVSISSHRMTSHSINPDSHPRSWYWTRRFAEPQRTLTESNRADATKGKKKQIKKWTGFKFFKVILCWPTLSSSIASDPTPFTCLHLTFPSRTRTRRRQPTS